MPKKQVTDLITGQEMTFARLVLAGTMTDREAAEAAGLNPDTAAYTKSRPRVRAYMLEQRAAVQQQLAQQEAEQLRQQGIGRDRILARLWDLASLSPEMTRNSISGQIKALSMIVAIEGLIPDRRAAKKPSAEPSSMPNIFGSSWGHKQQEEGAPLQPAPDVVPLQEEQSTPIPPPAAAPDTAPVPASALGSVKVNEYSFDYLAEALSVPAINPAAAFLTSTAAKPYLRRYGPF